MQAWLDCPTGLAGNMVLGALLDLGVSAAVIDEPLAALGLAGAYRLCCEQRHSGGLRGLHVQVDSCEPSPPHRHWRELRTQLLQAAWPDPLRQKVLAVFTLLAEAEAAVHGVEPEQIHFHEVGAIDALVDVVGVCAGLLSLGVKDLVCAPPPAGHGQVQTAHGVLPLPAPAVLEIARRRSVPLASSAGFAPGELTTPTGLALLACWADRFGPAPALVPARVGIGLGSRSLDRPNLLRLVLAPTAAGGGAQLETVLVQQAQMDDATPEDLAHLAQVLRSAGALEVYSQPIAMKKGRQGQLVTLLARPDQAEMLRQLWWQHSGSLGLRENLQQRWVLPRQILSTDTPLGPLRIKQTQLPDGRWRSKIEHDDLAALAERHGLSLEQVRAVVSDLLPPAPPASAPQDPDATAASSALWP